MSGILFIFEAENDITKNLSPKTRRLMKKNYWLLLIIPVVGVILLMIAIFAGIVIYSYYGNGDDGNDGDDGNTLPPARENIDAPRSQIVIDDGWLDTFDPDVPFEQPGHSRPISLQPREDMTIRADAGAFEEDVVIRVTDVSEQKMEELDRLMEQEGGGTMLFAYDLDAGLPPDSVIPGKYTVTIDLEKHGIPESMYRNFVMYRVAGDGHLQPLNVRINGHMASYQASQNSITIAGLCFLFGTLGLGSWIAYARLPAVMQTARRMADAGIWPSNWWKWDDAVFLYVEDTFGNFYVSYRYSMTENGAKAQEYVQKKNELIALERAMRDEAKIMYDNQHPPTLGTRRLPPAEQERRRIGIDSIFYRLMSNSQRVQDLANDTLLKTPESVEHIIRSAKLANRYCRSVQHMKPLSYEYVIYLTPNFEAFGQEAFRHQTPILDPIVVVNYSNLVVNGTYDQDKYAKILCTMAHETMHVYQMEYVACSLFKNDRYLEATGALVEHLFTDWLIRQGKITLASAESAEAAEMMGYTLRDKKEMLGCPLDKKYPSFQGISLVQCEGGYMLADLLQYMLDNQPNRRDTLDFAKMMNRYSVYKGLVKSIRDIFCIDTDPQFVKYFEGFCRQYIDDIETRQYAYRMQQAGDRLVMPDVEHDPSHCVMRIKNLGEKGGTTGYPFMANTFRIKAKPGQRKPYNLFAVNSEKVKGSEITFTFFMRSEFPYDRMYYEPNYSRNYPAINYAAVMTRPDSKGLAMGDDYYYDIVAFYQPQNTPAVSGPSLDKRGLLVRPKCQPVAELKEKGYVTGLQIAIKNNRTGKQQTYVVKNERWKDVFVATYDKLGITDTANIDLQMRSRWYYESPVGRRYYSPATDRVNYRKQRGTVSQTAERDTTTMVTGPEIEGDDDQGRQETTQPGGNPNGDQFVLDGDVYVWSEYVSMRGNDKYQFRMGLDARNPEQLFTGHAKFKDGMFTITVPAIHLKYWDDFDKVTREFDTPGFTATGKYTADPRSRNRGNVKVVNGSITCSPSTMTFKSSIDSREGRDPYVSSKELTVSPPNGPLAISCDSIIVQWEGDSIRNIRLSVPARVQSHYKTTFGGGEDHSDDMNRYFSVQMKCIKRE